MRVKHIPAAQCRGWNGCLPSSFDSDLVANNEFGRAIRSREERRILTTKRRRATKKYKSVFIFLGETSSLRGFVVAFHLLCPRPVDVILIVMRFLRLMLGMHREGIIGRRCHLDGFLGRGGETFIAGAF